MKRFNKVLSLLIAAIMISSLFVFGAMASTTTGVTEIFRDDFNDDDFSNWVNNAYWTFTENQNGVNFKKTTAGWPNELRSDVKSTAEKYITEVDVKAISTDKEFDIYPASGSVANDLVYKEGAGKYTAVCTKSTVNDEITITATYYKDNGSVVLKSGNTSVTAKVSAADYPNGIPVIGMNTNSGNADIASIKAYTLNGGVTITVDKINAQSLEITTDAPLDPATASFNAVTAGKEIASTTVDTVSIADRKYVVNFAEALDYGKTYTLTATTLNGLEGTALTANAPTFATAAYQMPEYVAPTPFFVEDVNATNTYTQFYSTSKTYSVTRENDAVTITSSGETGLHAAVSTVPDKYYIEYELNSVTSGKEFKVFPANNPLGNYQWYYFNEDIRNKTGVFYGYYDSTNDSYDVYYEENGEYKHISKYMTGSEKMNGIGILVNAADAKLKYLVAYPAAEDMSVEIGESNDSGVIFKTTMPINTSSSVAKVDGTQLKISNVSGQHLTYKAEFPAGLTDNIAEKGELSLTLKKLDGTLAMPETTFAFTLPVLDSSTPFFVETPETADNNWQGTSYNSSKAFTVEKKEDHVYVNSEGDRVLYAEANPTSNSWYIEYEVKSVYWANDFKIFPSAGEKNYYFNIKINNKKGVLYGLYNSVKGTYNLYWRDGDGNYTLLATQTGTDEMTGIGINVNNSQAQLGYIVAYPEAKNMTAQITGSDASGIEFKTSMPINTSTSVATVGGKALVLEPVSGQWCTYKAYFNEVTDVKAENTLKLTLTKLDGTAAMAETEFAFTLDSEATITNATTSEEDSKIHGAVRVLNTTNSEYKFTCIVASYTNEGKKLDDVRVEEITVPAGKAGVFTTTKAVDKAGTNTYFVFVWENMSNLIPIAY